MPQSAHRFAQWFLPLLIGFSILLSLHRLPILDEVPNRDSGVFLYMGYAALEGKVPYRDVWDHKGPFMYAINTLAVAINPTGLWGIWIVDVVMGIAALGIGFRLLRTYFGEVPAAFASLLWLIANQAMTPSNMTEYYVLFAQFLALQAAAWIVSGRQIRLASILSGVLLAYTALVRANLIGIFVAINLGLIIYILLGKRKLLIAIVYQTLLALSVLLLVILFFHRYGAVHDFFDAYIYFNMVYSSGFSSLNLGSTLSSGLNSVSGFGFALFAVIGWILAVPLLPKQDSTSKKVLILIAFFGFPIEIFLSSLSGRDYSHYFIAWLPAMTILASFFLSELMTKLAVPWKQIGDRAGRLLIFAGIFIILALPLLRTAIAAYLNYEAKEVPDVLAFMRNEVSDDSMVLIWGAETALNYVTGVLSPTRYTYQAPLFFPEYQSAGHTARFLADLEQNQPEYIIDTTAEDWLSLQADRRAEWAALRDGESDVTDPIFTYIDTHYEAIRTFDNAWVLYERIKLTDRAQM